MVLSKIRLHIPHHLQSKFRRKNTGILCLILLQNIRLHRPTHHLQCLTLDSFIHLGIHQSISRNTQRTQSKAIIALRQQSSIFRCLQPGLFKRSFHRLQSLLPLTLSFQITFHLLINRRVHKHSQYDRSRSINGHRNGGSWRGQLKSSIQLFHIVQRTDIHSRITNFPKNIWPKIRVFTI